MSSVKVLILFVPASMIELLYPGIHTCLLSPWLPRLLALSYVSAKHQSDNGVKTMVLPEFLLIKGPNPGSMNHNVAWLFLQEHLAPQFRELSEVTLEVSH